jgi:hypothetical protein
VSEATSASAVWKKTFVPSEVASWKAEKKAPLPPSGPVEISVVVAPARS